jgi:ATP-dependent RNA helicase RhlE
MTFQTLGLSEPLLKAVASEGYSIPTPIQRDAIPHVLAGRDLLGCAQTGTGKTAAFALPILHRLSEAACRAKSHGRAPRVLVISPTRELASQISQSFSVYGRGTRLLQAVVYGGVSQLPQERALRKGVDILIATPGRLLDLMNQGIVDLRAVETFVLDEADRMLDMGFMPDIRRIIAKLPSKRQTLFFSATMPPDIRQLADTLLRDPVTVKVPAVSAAADTVEQSVYLVDKRNKPTLLKHVLAQRPVSRALVFTRTKHGADKVALQLGRAGIRAAAIHGDKTQSARQKALESFKSQHPPILVATDVAARGLDIDNVSHVINYDVPNIPETYVHRIGRTGRAGASGVAVSFVSGEERSDLKAIERLIKQSITVERDHPSYPAHEEAAVAHTSGQHQRVDGHASSAAGKNLGARRRRKFGAGKPPFAGAASGPQKRFGKKTRRRSSALGR